MAEQLHRFGVEVLAWCLMTNHTHLVAVPKDQAALARAIGEAHHAAEHTGPLTLFLARTVSDKDALRQLERYLWVGMDIGLPDWGKETFK